VALLVLRGLSFFFEKGASEIDLGSGFSGFLNHLSWGLSLGPSAF
jgi:hypothetical protein